MTRSTTKSQTETATPHWIEWVTGIISAALVGALLTWLACDMTRHHPSDAQFQVRPGTIAVVSGGFRVSFDITNISQTSASQVRVTGHLKTQSGNSETAVATFDYVASEAQDHGALFFRSDPHNGDLTIRAESYVRP
jgi:uncharacterized protein (TIGR02588 family)